MATRSRAITGTGLPRVGRQWGGPRSLALAAAGVVAAAGIATAVLTSGGGAGNEAGRATPLAAAPVVEVAETGVLVFVVETEAQAATVREAFQYMNTMPNIAPIQVDFIIVGSPGEDMARSGYIDADSIRQQLGLAGVPVVDLTGR